MNAFSPCAELLSAVGSGAAVVRVRGDSGLAFGRVPVRHQAVSGLVVMLGSEDVRTASTFRYLRLMQSLVGNVRLAILTDSAPDLMRGSINGWLVEHLPGASGMDTQELACAVQRRAELLRTELIIVPGESGVTRSLHYSLSYELGVRVRWTAVAAASPAGQL